jgi:hypothetical protein
MKPRFSKITILFLCLTSLTLSLSAQTKKEEPKVVHIELVDGNAIEGKLLARRGDTVVVESRTLGTVNLNIKNIKNIDALTPENLKSGKYWFDNVHAIHGFVTPTAFNLRKGEGYYGNIFLFFNYAGYGFTDYFSISAGTELISILSGETGGLPSIFFINPKFSFKADKSLTIGAGVLLGISRELFDNNRQVNPLPYGVVTLGNRNNNLSVGLATAFDGEANSSVVTISGQARLSRGVALMSENFIGPDFNFGVSGFRFMNKNFAFNAGLMYSFGSDNNFIFENDSSLIPIPFLGLSVPFKTKKK